ncbi:MAG: Crp/Fnr family transcriptional regulator [Oscillospiraceae bacterium]|jgi:CRP/FNR family transcriptional regulator
MDGECGMLTEECKALLEERFSFWNELTPEQQKRLCDSTSQLRYEKGTSIHNGRENCLGLLLVRSGQLRVYMLSEQGRDVTLYRMFPGDICVLSASCVLDAITFDVFIDAEEDTDLLVVNSAAFHALADENVYVRCFGYEIATKRFSEVMWAMQQILFMGVDRRLAIFLIEELEKTGGDTVRLTHEQIARYMGSAREVVSRMLKYFESEGIVRLSRGGIRVTDFDKLRELAGK